MSNYEKAHPLEVPRALTEVRAPSSLGVCAPRLSRDGRGGVYMRSSEKAHLLEVPRALTEVRG